jgi:hypothetical protein
MRVAAGSAAPIASWRRSTPARSGDALPAGGVLDAGAIEQVEQLGGVRVGSGGPRFDVGRGRELFAGFDLGDPGLPPPLAEALGELRSRGPGGESQLTESLGELAGRA